jgi:hypothetical protein
VYNQVADYGCCYETREGEYIGDVVDLFMSMCVELERRFEGCCEFVGC